jgi:hypothetical protein
MTSEYEKLLSLVSKINDCEGEICLICHFPDKDKNLIKLECQHYFHLKCIPSSNKLLEYIKCPYCDKNCKYHKGIVNTQNKQINISQLECQTIIKSGSRKGERCSRINCKYHKPKSIVV